MNAVFWALLVLVSAAISCSDRECSETEPNNFGLTVANKTGEALTLHLTPTSGAKFVAAGASRAYPSAPQTTYEVKMTSTTSGFQTLWEQDLPVPQEPRGKLDPGLGKASCAKGSSTPIPRQVYVTFSAADLQSYALCRDVHDSYEIYPSGSSCPEGAYRVTVEENAGPVQVTGAAAESINGAACSYATVACAEWRPEGSLSQGCAKRNTADAFGFSCDYRTWYPTLHCADPDFPPARSTNGVYTHCADASGNIRKADSWQQGEWEEVFCLPEQIGEWIKISSASRDTLHYLYCQEADLKYPWPWSADAETTPYQSCKSGEQAVLGATASDFSCKKSD